MVALCSLLLFLAITCEQAKARSLFDGMSNLERAGETLAEELAENKLLNGKRIAVLEFEPHGNSAPSMLGKRIAEYVGLALVKDEKRTWTVVERLELARLHNEMSEHKEHSVDYNEWMRRHLSADVLILGSYVLSGKKLRITAKAVDPVNGSTIASATVSRRTDTEIKQLSRTRKPATDFAREVEDITATLTGRENYRRTGQQSQVKLFKLAGGNRINFKQGMMPVFNPGDEMGFSVRPPMNSKLYILNYDPAAEHGQAILLYPIPLMDVQTFNKQRTSFFPAIISQGVSFYKVEEPFGRMLFKIIGIDSSVSMDLSESLKEEDGYYWLDSNNLSSFIEALSSLPDNAWWSEDIEFWIEP
ncbi:hypothetical protein [Maridesulfovibrio salexigens]|uniref:hypothetical protein n=1 Tax=Maridesulfovibrio salexigens TaxID=880 RepID=UPI0012ED6457|nr:hypothetical protein [Maridesulfovibrio salexigens]